jgi:hypothetical protein
MRKLTRKRAFLSLLMKMLTMNRDDQREGFSSAADKGAGRELVKGQVLLGVRRLSLREDADGYLFELRTGHMIRSVVLKMRVFPRCGC